MKVDPMEQQFNMREQLQREQIAAEYGLNAPYLSQTQKEVQAQLLEQLDPNNIVVEMKATLMGFRWDEMTHNFVKEGEPLMNMLGVGRMVASLRSLVNQGQVMSAMTDDKMINKIMLDYTDDIIDDLTINWEIYEIKYETDLDRIEGICKRMGFAALMRSLGGGERSFLGKTTVESINSVPRMQPQKKGGILSMFKFH